MNDQTLFAIDAASIIDLAGADAIAILNNLTTNDVKSLEVGSGCETFVTDVRGKTLGHVFAFRTQDGCRLIGAPGQSEAIATHVDRYTIREDVTTTIRDADFQVFVSESAVETPYEKYALTWLGPDSTAIIVPGGDVDVFRAERGNPTGIESETSFHTKRVAAGFPWHGVDLDESNLPQEADRDAVAICLTKGCYLGQETVARLDALGQVQKKLVRWLIEGFTPATGAILTADEKKVGRLTSVATDENGKTIALGFARRSHFEPGAEASGTDELTGTPFTAEVTGTLL